MDSLAADYVRLVLAAGRHDDNFVDAFGYPWLFYGLLAPWKRCVFQVPHPFKPSIITN